MQLRFRKTCSSRRYSLTDRTNALGGILHRSFFDLAYIRSIQRGHCTILPGRSLMPTSTAHPSAGYGTHAPTLQYLTSGVHYIRAADRHALTMLTVSQRESREKPKLLWEVPSVRLKISRQLNKQQTCVWRPAVQSLEPGAEGKRRIHCHVLPW